MSTISKKRKNLYVVKKIKKVCLAIWSYIRQFFNLTGFLKVSMLSAFILLLIIYFIRNNDFSETGLFYYYVFLITYISILVVITSYAVFIKAREQDDYIVLFLGYLPVFITLTITLSIFSYVLYQSWGDIDDLSKTSPVYYELLTDYLLKIIFPILPVFWSAGFGIIISSNLETENEKKVYKSNIYSMIIILFVIIFLYSFIHIFPSLQGITS